MIAQWPNMWPVLSAALPSPKLRVLSLGAGVQSTTLALAAARREVGPMPDMAIFADTGWEPRHVMEHLDRLERKLPFPLVRVSAGDLREASMAGFGRREGRYASVPFFTREVIPATSTAGVSYRDGMGRRQCTGHYKIEPIQKHLREVLGYAPRARIPADTVEMWIGISTDEISRMRPARVRWIANRWPLIEADKDRNACINWMAERQERAAKSACLGCPFHTNAQWRDMRDNYPDEWEQTCRADEVIRHSGSSRPLRSAQYMHPSRVPLRDAPIDEPTSDQLGFDMECEGMCGV